MHCMTIEGTPGYKQISNLSAASDNAHSMIPGETWGVEIIHSLSPEKYNPSESMVDWMCRAN